MLLLSLILACESEPVVDEKTTSTTANVEESKVEATTSEVTNTVQGKTTSSEPVTEKSVSEDEITSTESE